MLKLAGACLLLGGLSWLGIQAAGELGRRVSLLRQLIAALDAMRRELVFRLTPLPQLCDRLAGETPQPLSRFFSDCGACARSGEEPFAQGWARAAKGLAGALDGEAVACLIRLGGSLGRCGSEEEGRLLEAAVEELGRLLARWEEDSRRLGRLYGVLGLTGGALLVILLI